MIAYELSMHRLFRAAPQHPRNPTSNKMIPKEIILGLRDGKNGVPKLTRSHREIKSIGNFVSENSKFFR